MKQPEQLKASGTASHLSEKDFVYVALLTVDAENWHVDLSSLIELLTFLSWTYSQILYKCLILFYI